MAAIKGTTSRTSKRFCKTEAELRSSSTWLFETHPPTYAQSVPPTVPLPSAFPMKPKALAAAPTLPP